MAKKTKPKETKSPAPVKKKKETKPKEKPKVICPFCGGEYASETSMKKHKCSGQLKSGFMVRFKATAYFKKVIEIINKWCEDAKIRINKDALIVESTDPGKVGYIQFTTERSKFSVYNIGKDETSAVIKVPDLKNVMARGEKDDTLTLFYDTDVMKFTVIFSTKTGRKRTFKIGVMDDDDFPDLENSFSKMRDYEWPVYFNVDPGILEQIIKDANVYAEIINFETINDNEDINLWTVGPGGSYESEFGTDEIVNLMIDKPCKSMWSITHLLNVLAIKIMTKELTFQTDHGRPAILTFELKNGMEIMYGQAPRAEQGYDDYDEDVDEIEAAVEKNKENEDEESEDEEEFVDE